MIPLQRTYKVGLSALDYIRTTFHFKDENVGNASCRLVEDEYGISKATAHVHTIDPARSELYKGQQVAYVDPCTRIADNRRAWPHFNQNLQSTNKTRKN